MTYRCCNLLRLQLQHVGSSEPQKLRGTWLSTTWNGSQTLLFTSEIACGRKAARQPGSMADLGFVISMINIAIITIVIINIVVIFCY